MVGSGADLRFEESDLPEWLNAYYDRLRKVVVLARHTREWPRRRVRYLKEHEITHHLSPRRYRFDSPGSTRIWHEGAIDRETLKRLVPDEQVKLAILNGPRELWELAEEWDLEEDRCRQRVEIFFAEHPEWRRSVTDGYAIP